MNLKQKSICIGPPRYTIAVKALAWLSQSGSICSSAAIAEQVNSHAAFLRRVMATLVNAGLVEAKEGRDGGYSLKLPPEQILLADVYLAMKGDCAEAEPEVESELELDCGEAGLRFELTLSKIMVEAEQRMLEHLQQFSIADLL